MWRKLPLLSALLLAACQQDNLPDDANYDVPATPVTGGGLNSASLGAASNLIWFISGDSASHQIAGNLYRGLLKYDAELNLVGDLAQSWVVSDDGKKITFTLNPQAKWQDGTALTTVDVSATLHAITAPTTRTPYGDDYHQITKMDVHDAQRFSVHYAEPFAPALASWASFMVLPAHKLTETNDIHENDLSHTPFANGPYTLQNWQREQLTELKANPQDDVNPPHISHKRIRVIPDQDTQFMELRHGQVDLMGLTPLQFERLQNNPKLTKHYNTYAYPGNGYTYVGFNLARAPFNDKNLRLALSYATPRQALIDGILRGQGQTLCCPFKPGSWAYNTELAPIPYDLKKARTYLEKAGWSDTDGDGLVDKDGKPLHFTLVTNQGNSQRIQTAQILQAAWRELGVDLKILVQEWSTFIENTVNAKNFDAILLGWNLGNEPDPFPIWHSSQTGPRQFNIIDFKNTEADQHIEAARRTFVQSERQQHLWKFQEIIHTEQPYLFLYAPQALVAVHKRIYGVQPAPAGLSYNASDWFVPQQLQRPSLSQQ